MVARVKLNRPCVYALNIIELADLFGENASKIGARTFAGRKAAEVSGCIMHGCIGRNRKIGLNPKVV